MDLEELQKLYDSGAMIYREKFRKALADLDHAEATCFSHWALKAYDMVHHPELRN